MKDGHGTATTRWERLLASAGPPAPVRLLCATGICGEAAGADVVFAALRTDPTIRARNLPVVATGCDGHCSDAVVVTLQRDGEFVRRWTRVTPEDIGTIAAELDGPVRAAPAYAGQTRQLLRHAGAIDPVDLDEALRRGRYRALATVLDRRPEEVVVELEQSGLAGRGGAYFPLGTKLSACRGKPAPRYLVMNAEEGEPGVYKDRHLLESDPHLVLEGLLIAAYAIGAAVVIAFVNGDAGRAGDRLLRAIETARARGLIGGDILGSGFACEVDIRFGAGGYVLGEESALLESIEGQRPMPRFKPPLPVHAGLFGRPTAVDNVETLAAAALVMAHGADAFRASGTERWPGTKLVCVSGDVARPGLVEVQLGATVRQIIDLCGGAPAGVQAVLTGGPSGNLISPAHLDRALVPKDEIALLGSGNLTVLDAHRDVPAFVRRLARFNAEESCGKCTPCREGTRVMLEMLDRLQSGADSPSGREELEALCETVASASLCGLGQMAPNPILSWLANFPPHPNSRTEAAHA